MAIYHFSSRFDKQERITKMFKTKLERLKAKYTKLSIEAEVRWNLIEKLATVSGAFLERQIAVCIRIKMLELQIADLTNKKG